LLAPRPFGCAGKFELLPFDVGIWVQQTGEFALKSQRPNDSEIGSETRYKISSLDCTSGVIGNSGARRELTQGNSSANARKPHSATELPPSLKDRSRSCGGEYKRLWHAETVLN